MVVIRSQSGQWFVFWIVLVTVAVKNQLLKHAEYLEWLEEIKQTAEDAIILPPAPPPAPPLRATNTNTTITNTTTTTNNNNNNTNNKPHFVFHIGIPKTGTTSIQCVLAQLSRELASQDSYYYIGKQCPKHESEPLGNGEMPVHGHWLPQELDKGKLLYIGAKLNATLQRHLRHDGGRTSTTGIIFSSEVFATDKWKADQRGFDLLKRMLKGYSVRIVVGYRRYFEWLPSFIYQENLLQPFSYSMVESIRWFLNSASNTTTTTNNNNNNNNNNTLHMTTRAIKIWSAQFDDVYVFNMNQEGDLVTNFVCQALPGPPTHVCRTLLVDTSTNKATNATASYNDTSPNNKNRNVAKDINWLRLVAVARESGWKNTTEEEWERSQSRFEVFQTNHPEEYQSFLSCLTKEEQEQLLNLSLAYEKELVATATATVDKKNKHLGKLLSPSNVEDHRQNFYEHVRKRKYCEMDVYRALSNTNSSFFRFVLPTRQNNRQSPEDNILPSR